jgi:mannose-1-phosphate guanylyltransferase/mannose-6-phosphate isomerase
MVLPIILAGGKGSRLWPISREAMPKPYVPLNGSSSTLLQSTISRLAGIEDFGPPIVVCNAEHGFLVQQQAMQVTGDQVTLLLEPSGRNTAPAICAAALVAQRITGSDEPIVIFPADHHISDQQAFADAMKSGCDLAGSGYLVTFSVEPTEPATGYGYLRVGQTLDGAADQFLIEAFVEKPSLDKAREFIASGQYKWNSGMFAFRPSVLLEAFRSLQPEILRACEAAVARCNADSVMKIDAAAFEAAKAVSVDYAIMERATNVATVVADLGWSDVGDWQAVWKAGTADASGVVGQGNVLSVDSENSLLKSDGPLVVGVGLKNMIAVATRDAIIVAPIERSQDVKCAVDRMSALGLSEANTGKKVLRPWGYYEQIQSGAGFQVKQLSVHPGAKLSLQRHKHRSEHWVCIAGEGLATRGNELLPLSRQIAIDIPLGMVHRLENPGAEMLHVIEVQFGSYLGEDDIERFEDIYDRV